MQLAYPSPAPLSLCMQLGLGSLKLYTPNREESSHLCYQIPHGSLKIPKKLLPLRFNPMNQFRRAEDKDNDDPRSSLFSPPSIIRESSSAFSKPILPSSSSLLSPKPHFAGASAAPSSNGAAASIGFAPAPDPPTTPTSRYRECLRNHAASLGGHVIDGCGEFMPSGPADPLKCAACGCHRSFHRKEQPEPDASKAGYRVPLLLPPPSPHPNPLRFSGNTTDQSSSEGRNNAGTKINFHGHCSPVSGGGGDGSRKKRFRTKFSSQQKEKMKAFAERVGWRVQKKDEGEMERFCNEIGVSRQVLKVWMHNNKHLNLKKQQGDEEREVQVERIHHHHHHHQPEVDGGV